MDEMTLLRDLLGSDPGPSAAIDTAVGIALSKEYERANGEAAEPGTKDGAGHARADSSLTRPPRRFLGKRVLLAAATVVLVATGLVVAGTHTSSPPGRITAWHAARPITSVVVSQNPPHSTGWQLVDDLVSTGWQQNTVGPPPGYLDCPTVSACFALSGAYASAKGGSPLLSESLYVSSDLGESWSVLPMPIGFDPSTLLSCPTATSCYVGGTIAGKSIFLSTANAGHQWTIQSFGLPGFLSRLSCAGGTSCIGVESSNSMASENIIPVSTSIVRTTDGGETWTSLSLPAQDHRATALSCSTPLDCVVAGSQTGPQSPSASENPGFVLATHNGGADWTEGHTPPNFSWAFNAVVSCSTASTCMAAGVTTIPNPNQCIGPNRTNPPGSNWCGTNATTLVTAIAVTTDGGVTWHIRPLPSDIPNPQLTTLSCASAEVCWLGGQEAVPQVIGNAHDDGSPVILGTTNGGSTWKRVTFTVPVGAPNYDGQSYQSIGWISCPTTGACVALGAAAQGAKTTAIYSYEAAPGPGG
jgi:hypothetical protein